jgi:hypothetical protein
VGCNDSWSTCFISGKGGELVDSGNNTYGGKYVINPSGGLISKGHPLGATGTLLYRMTSELYIRYIWSEIFSRSAHEKSEAKIVEIDVQNL